ncbi:MAG: DUF134 domain-containing protein [Anaeromyxobacter sp.]
MPRPQCCRRVRARPGATCFCPANGTPKSDNFVMLTLDELEALRLADLEGLYQERAAERMNVSRSTFGRIIEAAHRKVADALVHGRTLQISGGAVVTDSETSNCRELVDADCGCRRCHTGCAIPSDEPSGATAPPRPNREGIGTVD